MSNLPLPQSNPSPSPNLIKTLPKSSQTSPKPTQNPPVQLVFSGTCSKTPMFGPLLVPLSDCNLPCHVGLPGPFSGLPPAPP